MTKVAAAVIRNGDKVLLMRRAKNKSFAGQWEYPGGKVESGERVSQALKRELQEELEINATIGNLITSVHNEPYTIFAYDVISYAGEIKLNVHDAMEWVDISELTKHPQLPADKKISEIVCAKHTGQHVKNNENPIHYNIETRSRLFAFNRVRIPEYDETTCCWVVKYIDNDQEFSKSLQTRDESYIFYLKKINDLMNMYKKQSVITK